MTTYPLRHISIRVRVEIIKRVKAKRLEVQADWRGPGGESPTDLW